MILSRSFIENLSILYELFFARAIFVDVCMGKCMEQLVIIGAGCAGLTAGIYAGRAGLVPIIIEGPLPGGLLSTTSDVENFPGFPEGVNGFELTQQMHKQAEKFDAKFVADRVQNVTKVEGGFHIQCENFSCETRTLIMATGASHRMLNVPGEQAMYGGKGVSACATCDGAFYRNRDVVVVGGGDTACEEALFLTRFAKKVYMIHRRDQLRASNIMAQRVTTHEKIEMVWSGHVTEILSSAKGLVRGVTVDVKGERREIACEGVFLAIGHEPNTELFKGLVPLDERGYVQTKDGVCTQVSGLFAAGDCVDSVYRQAVTAAGSGCKAAIEVVKFLSA